MERIVRKPWMFVAVIAVVLSLGYFVGAKAGMEEEREQWEMEQQLRHVEMFRTLLGLITDYTQIARDEDAAGVAAVMGLDKHVEGIEEHIELLEDLLDDAENDVVRRAIHLQLSEKYGELGQHEEAREHLGELILAD